MKKVLATVMAVAMMLTMIIAMPVSADAATTVGPNLVVNGSFEDGLNNWTQTGETQYTATTGNGAYAPTDGTYVAYAAHETNTEMQTQQQQKTDEEGNPVTDESGNPVMEDVQVPVQVPKTTGLKQTVTLDTDADWYINQDNYVFDLYADIYGGQGTTSMTVTVYNDTAGDTATKTFTYGGAVIDACVTGHYPLTAGTMNTTSFGISGLMGTLSGNAKYIDVTFASTGEAAWDNIKIIPSINLVKNGSFEANAATTFENWTRPDDSTAGFKIMPRTGKFLIPEDGESIIYQIKTNDVVMQRITLDENADYFLNQDKYVFDILFSYYHRSVMEVTVWSADETASATTEFNGAGIWSLTEAKLSLNDAMAQVGKAKYIDIYLKNVGSNTETAFDHIRLTPVLKTGVSDDNNMLKNAGFEETTESGSLAEWTEVNADKELVEVVSDAAKAPGGRNFVSLWATTVSEGSETKNIGGSIEQSVSLEEGKIYVIEGKYKSVGEAALIKVSDTENGENNLLEVTPAATGTTFDTAWGTFKYSVLAEENMADVNVVFGCNPDAVNEGDGVYFENVKIYVYTPVENVDPKNLLVNGSFEKNVTGETDIRGWDVTENADPSKSSYVKSASEVGKPCRDGNNMLIHYGSVVSQTVEITDYDSVNGQNYGYTLSFEYNSYDGGRLAPVIKATFEDSEQNTEVQYIAVKVYDDGEYYNEEKGYADEYWSDYSAKVEEGTTFKYFCGNNRPVTNVEIDLSSITQKTTSPLKSLTIQLNAVGTRAYLDDFALYAQKSNVAIVDKDGNFISELPSEEGMTLLAEGEYYGSTADAKLIFAEYNVIDEDTLELVQIDIVGLDENGEFADAMLGGLTLTSGEQVVKAYIIEKGTLTPVAMAEVK